MWKAAWKTAALSRQRVPTTVPVATPADVHALYPSRRSLSAKVRVFIDALMT